MIGTQRITFIPGHARARGAPRHRRRRHTSVGFLAALKRLWALSDGLCGKRLVVFLRETVPQMQRQGILQIADSRISQHLLTVSSATLGRILASTKREARLKGRSTTRPGTLLKHHIPIRTFAD